MKGNRRQPAVASKPTAPPASPTSKSTSKYANRDGSKIISVPKISSPAEPSQPSPTAAAMPSTATAKSQVSSGAPAVAEPAGDAAPTVNRKKAKRRAKAAAKAAAEAGLNSEANGLPSPTPSSQHAKQPPLEAGYSDDEQDSNHGSAQANGNPVAQSKGKKGKKKKDGAGPSASANRAPSPVPHRSPGRASGISKEKIWNTSSQEERQRIKEFWLGLGEEERKSLVKVEKDAVLKKMKEQQKHTCSCSVCGRKRTAIEEELEGLYDAYYEELESFANQPNHNGEIPPMLAPSRHYGATPGYASQVRPSSYPTQQASRGRIVEGAEDDDDDEEGDEDYSDEELDDDEEYSDEEEPEDIHRDQQTEYQTDFFNFGNSLQVQGGILTVADDLLKNDGKKFIEMMEQLAERRMAREEDAKDQFTRNYHMNGTNYPAHPHPPPPEDEEEYDEEEEEDEYDSQDEEYDEEEVQTNPVHCACCCPHHGADHGNAGAGAEGGASASAGARESRQGQGQESQAKQHRHQQDTMTEEQRMEEGRRMFQIFAARMFEQRVLTAYREKVARERQEKLLEELAEESREADQRKAKKAKEAQKRKDKQQQKKQAQAEEKARKEAEKAAEDAERLAEERRKAEESRLKAEERRRKKEAQKKAEEEEKLRKEAERQRRLHEQKERQAELERKQREAKEKEKKAKDEAKQREKAAREQKEREARERKEKAEKDRLEKEAKAKAEKEAKEKQRKEDRAAQKAAALASAPIPVTLAKRPAPQPNAAPVLTQGLQQPVAASPQIPVATPALPKVPAMKSRRTSQEPFFTAPAAALPQTNGPIGTTNPTPPNAATPVHTSPVPTNLLSKGNSSQGNPLHSQATSPLNSSIPTVPHLASPFSMPHHNPLNHQFPPGIGPMNAPPGLPARGFADPMFAAQQGHRGPLQLGQQAPPGLGMPMQPIGRGFGPVPQPPPGLPLQPSDFSNIGPFGSLPKDASPLHQHSRHTSGSFEGSGVTATAPIARPAPIGRPGSVVHGQRATSGSPAVPMQPHMEDSNPAHLGSSVLLDDSDEPLDFGAPRRSLPGMQARPFPPPVGMPFGLDHGGPFTTPLWGQSAIPQGLSTSFGSPFSHPPPPPGFGGISMQNTASHPWPAPMAAGNPFGSPRSTPQGLLQMRILLCRACQELSDSKAKPDPDDGYVPLEDVKAKMEHIGPGESFSVKELINISDTEGNQNNGGGSFLLRFDGSHKPSIKWLPSAEAAYRAVGRGLGEIGSPIIGSGASGSPWQAPLD